MPRCLIVQPIHASGVTALEAAGFEVVQSPSPSTEDVIACIDEANALIVREASLAERAIDAAPQLRVVAKHGVGVSTLPLARLAARGIPVVYTPGTNTRSTAEQAIGLMFACARRLVEADQAVREHRWTFRYELGIELGGRTLGVIGFGAVGRRVAKIAAHGLAMRVGVYSPRATDAEIAAAGATRTNDLDTLLRESDVITLHRSSRPDTLGMIGVRELALMKRSAILINTARGDLIDEPALANALRDRRIAAAGLDVLTAEPPPRDSPLLALPNVVLAPHLGNATEEAMRATAALCVSQILDVFAGRTPPHRVGST
jgi:D-3-phosphoglycerate dehydrogenase / 2-oxoglutarate reductase